MKIGVNLDDVKEVVDPGWYPVRVIGAEVKTSRPNPETGETSQYIQWEMEIVDPSSDFHEWKQWVNTPIAGRGAAILKRFLEACEYEWGEDGFATEDVIGSELEVQVEVREFEGKPRNDVRAFRPLV